MINPEHIELAMVLAVIAFFGWLAIGRNDGIKNSCPDTASDLDPKTTEDQLEEINHWLLHNTNDKISNLKFAKSLVGTPRWNGLEQNHCYIRYPDTRIRIDFYKHKVQLVNADSGEELDEFFGLPGTEITIVKIESGKLERSLVIYFKENGDPGILKNDLVESNFHMLNAIGENFLEYDENGIHEAFSITTSSRRNDDGDDSVLSITTLKHYTIVSDSIETVSVRYNDTKTALNVVLTFKPDTEREDLIILLSDIEKIRFDNGVILRPSTNLAYGYFEYLYYL